MKITKDTTDEQILAGVVAAKERIREALADPKGSDSESLAKEVNSLASAEGRAQARWMLRDALTFEDATAEGIERTLIGLVMNGADDRWSGRTNDVRRARFDGLRDEVHSLTQFGGIAKILKGEG